MLFADAAALTADPALTEPARNAARAVAGHLADLIRRAQAKGGIRADADPEAAAWLLLSVLSARRLRAAAMPDSLEPEVTALALQALAPPAAAAGSRDQPPPDTRSARTSCSRKGRRPADHDHPCRSRPMSRARWQATATSLTSSFRTLPVRGLAGRGVRVWPRLSPLGAGYGTLAAGGCLA
ncbi:MAG: hypothetical protein ACHP9Z_16550 [Streptosporangiales bacterium]